MTLLRSSRKRRPVRTFQSSMLPAISEVSEVTPDTANSSPFGLKVPQVGKSHGPLKVWIVSPDSPSTRRRSAPSTPWEPPMYRARPTGLNASPPVFISAVRSSEPVTRFHTLTVLSSALAIKLPSADIERLLTWSACPLSSSFWRPVVVSQTCTVWSSPPQASVFPSGLNANDKGSPEANVLTTFPSSKLTSWTNVLYPRESSLSPLTATRCPSGEVAIALQPVLARIRRLLPVLTSHNSAPLSSLQLATEAPLAVNVTPVSLPPLVGISLSSLPVLMSHNCTESLPAPASPTAASSFPSGLNVIDLEATWFCTTSSGVAAHTKMGANRQNNVNSAFCNVTASWSTPT